MEKQRIPFTASEIATLWQQYMQETLGLCVLQYFINCVEDNEIRSVIQTMLDSVKAAIQSMRAFFEQESLPVPVGFTEQDVNVQAPRLYSDPFMLQYISFMTHVGSQSACTAVTVTPRSDLRQFFIKRANDFLQLEDQTFNVLLEKGLYSKAPMVPYPQRVEFLPEKGFLGDLFAKQLPINTIEINHLFINSLRNAIGMILLTGFAQTAQTTAIRDYILKGKDISKEFMKLFNTHLVEEDLLPVTLPGFNVTSSTEAPFSEKLMLNLVAFLNVYAFGVYGVSLSQSSRKDLNVMYARVMAETVEYTSDGVDLLTQHQYLEAPPRLPDRDQLGNE